MAFYVFFIAAYYDEVDNQWKGVREFEIPLAEPDEERALAEVRALAGGRQHFYVRRIVKMDPELERPDRGDRAVGMVVMNGTPRPVQPTWMGTAQPLITLDPPEPPRRRRLLPWAAKDE